MNKIFLVAVIIGAVGVSLIAGIVSYQFIQQQIQEQKQKERMMVLANPWLQNEYDTNFRKYALESSEKCGKDKKCWDANWEKYGLSDPKFKVLREIKEEEFKLYG
jgi:Na+-translocating ferredoxin:NAD+ oxidoreductase RnfG subunit